MSTQQANSACLVSVDLSTADILRRQTLIILEANHYYFEDILEFGPEGPNTPFRSSTATPSPSSTPSAGAAPNHRRPASTSRSPRPSWSNSVSARYDLGHTHIDRLAVRDGASDPAAVAEIDSAIEFGRLAAEALDALIARLVLQ